METTQPHDDTSTKTTYPIVRIVLGVLFLLPALFCCLFQLVIPTVSTFLMSFQEIDPFRFKATYVGLNNYADVFGSEQFGRAAGFTLAMLLVRVLVIALVPILVAWAAAHFGPRLRLGLRILFTLPVVLFAPVAIAATWFMFLNPTNGFFPLEGSWVANATSARSTLLFIDALYLFGLASALGLTVYLPLWRRSADTFQPTFREVWKPLRAIWALGILATIVLTLSTFSLSLVLTKGGPTGSTNTLGTLFYQFGFTHLTFGPAASVASLILFVTLILGTVAGLLVILNRLRLDLVDKEPAQETTAQPISPTGSRVLPGILVLLALGICLFSALPFGWLIPQALGGDGLGHLLEMIPEQRVLINTFLPPAVTATLQILITYLTALSIGALRPLGKRSEWLLLLFSPWLFISVLPLGLVHYLSAREAGIIGSLAGSLSPIRFSIPALFVLTIFFAGRASQRQGETTAGESQDVTLFFEQFILPSLPLAVVLWLLLIFFNGQDLIWAALVSSPERFNVNLWLLQLVGRFGGAGGMLAAAITYFVLPVCIFFFICLALFQVYYLDRLVLYSEDPATEEAAEKPEQK